jgi:hypothetical protein
LLREINRRRRATRWRAVSWSVRIGGIAIVALLAAVAGCGEGTSLLVELTVEEGATVPAGVDVSIFSPRGALVRDRRVATPTLPGWLVVRGLPDADTTVRVVARAGALLGGTRADVRGGRQTAVAVALSTTTGDRDDDGVPDGLDVCPDVPDATQDDADGDGRGDACAGPDAAVPDDGGAASDLAVPIDGGASTCPVAGALLCEGFETAGINRNIWNPGTRNGTVAIDRTRAYRGGGSLKVTVDPTPDVDLGARYSQAQIYEYSTFPQNPLYIRAFLWLDQMPSYLRPSLMVLQQGPAPYAGVMMSYDNPYLEHFSFNWSPRYAAVASAPFPTGRWVCVEWLFRNGSPDAGGSDGELRLWIDGAEVPELALNDIALVPPVSKLGFGVEIVTYPAAAGFSIWYDEIIVSSTPIGCAR